MKHPSRTLFASDSVRAGTFDCPPEHPMFASGPPPCQMVVFPKTPIRLSRTRDRTRVVDSTVAVVFAKGEEFQRHGLHPTGDRSHWFAWRPADENETLPAIVPIDRALYARQHLAITRLTARAVEPLAAEEQVVEIVAGVIGQTQADRPSEPTDAHRDLALRAVGELGRDLAAPVTLGSLASRLGTSPSHLCRIFRAVTGITLRAYRRDLRLRAALDDLANPKADLSEIGLRLGFASHSHFTLWFRRGFGRPPSAVRTALSSPGERHSSHQRTTGSGGAGRAQTNR